MGVGIYVEDENKFFFNNKECTIISLTDLTSVKEVENLKS